MKRTWMALNDLSRKDGAMNLVVVAAGRRKRVITRAFFGRLIAAVDARRWA